MSSFIKMVSVFVLSGAACFAVGCVGSTDDNMDDENVSDAAQAQSYGDIGNPSLDAGQYSKYSKKALPPTQSELPPVQQTAPFSKYSKKAPPPIQQSELPPVQQTPFSKYSKKAPPPIQNPIQSPSELPPFQQTGALGQAPSL